MNRGGLLPSYFDASVPETMSPEPEQGPVETGFAAWRKTPGGIIVTWAVFLLVLVALVSGGVVLVRGHAKRSAAATTTATTVACHQVKAALARVGGAETALNSGASIGDQPLLKSLDDVVAVIDANVTKVPTNVTGAMVKVKLAAASVQATVSSQYQSGSSAPAGSGPSTNQSLQRFSLANSGFDAVCPR